MSDSAARPRIPVAKCRPAVECRRHALYYLPVGQRLVVQIPGRRRGSSLSRLAQVLRVEPDGEGRWLVDCQMIPGRRRGSSLSRLAQVLRVEPDGEGRWLVGCQMSSPLSDEEIRLLGRTSKVPTRPS